MVAEYVKVEINEDKYFIFFSFLFKTQNIVFDLVKTLKHIKKKTTRIMAYGIK